MFLVTMPQIDLTSIVEVQSTLSNLDKLHHRMQQLVTQSSKTRNTLKNVLCYYISCGACLHFRQLVKRTRFIQKGSRACRGSLYRNADLLFGDSLQS